MTQQAIVSPDSGKYYNLYIHNHKAVGCTCEYRKYHTFVSCKHMNGYNQPVVEQKQDQYPELDSCDCCGRLIKKGTMTCSKCLGC